MDIIDKELSMNAYEMAACGLNCETCEIRLAPSDPHAAEVVIKWFISKGWLAADEGMPEVIKRKMYCTGCLGNRGTHWSADCWILACCVDQHGLTNCSQCIDFPCLRLIDWSQQDLSYQIALDNLKQLKSSCGP
jgi:hypothetical protein